MLEVVCAVLCMASVVVHVLLVRRSSDWNREVLDALEGRRLREDAHGERIGLLEDRASTAEYNHKTMMLRANTHTSRLDAIEARLPKPRAPRKRKGNALKSAVDAVATLDADS